MKCSVCKNDNAIIHIREYTDSGIRKINLCLECALKRGFNASLENIDNMLSKIIRNIFNEPDKTRNGRKSARNIQKEDIISLVCPSCGTTVQDFTNTLELGCPVCYSVFDRIIDLILFNHNNSLNYLGKLPDEIKIVNIQKDRLRKLKKELIEHVNNENFNKAALVRDEISKLKKNIRKGSRQIANG